MKLTYNNQTIDLFPQEVPEVMPLSLSGGLDSASAFYLISKYFPQVEIIPYTCRDQNAPKDAEAAEKIVRWMQREFPNNNIRDIQVFDFNDRTEDFVTNEEVDNVINEWPQFNGMRRTQVSKIIQIDQISRNLMAKHPGAVRLDGMTRNPPTEDMHRLGFYDKAERRRDHEQPKVEEWRTVKTICEAAGTPILPMDHTIWLHQIYQVYANVDKKFVAGVYKENNLMDTLFPLTRSCVGRPKETDNFTKECHRCFWCYEKAWAFNLKWLYETIKADIK